MARGVWERLVPALQIGVLVLLGLNTLMGCWCGVSHSAIAPAKAEEPPRPIAERGIATFGR